MMEEVEKNTGEHEDWSEEYRSNGVMEQWHETRDTEERNHEVTV